MKLALAIHAMFPDGGLQRDFATIASRLAAAGHEVHALATAWEGPRPAGVAVHLLGVRGHSNHARMAAFGRALGDWRDTARPDALTGFNRLPGLDIHYCGDVSFIAEAGQRGPLYRMTPRYRTYAALERAVFDPAAGTQILALSRRTADGYRQVHGTPEERFHLLPPGIDPSRQRPKDAAARGKIFRAALGIPASVPLVLAIGARMDTKGVDRTLAALAAISSGGGPQAHLLVLGRGDIATIHKRAVRLGLYGRIHLPGPRSEVVDALCAADVLAHPARRENTGGAILEAIVAGLPVVATANCGFAEHIARADAGIVLDEPFDAAAYAGALVRALRGPDRTRWSAAGVIYGRTEDLYSGLDTAAATIAELAAARG
ncbi:MAG: glycosyltransferase family 4 protein [Rhodospirillaceae bacterium]|nr:glycosyltransferase family 4 protein [Rhodospirillaceae bacterium]